MELWLVYACISALLVWINNFFLKIFSEKGFDGSVISIAQGLTYMILWAIHAGIVSSDIWLHGNWLLLIPTFLIIIFYFTNIRIRLAVLKYLSSSEYFVSYRIISTAVLIVLWIFIFNEVITLAQWFGLIIWSIGILFLFEEDTRLRKWHNWRRSLVLLLISVGAWVWIQVMNKYIAITDNLFSAILFYQWVITVILFGSIEWSKAIKYLKKQLSLKQLLIVAFSTTTISYFATVFNLLSYSSGGNLSIVTKINAYSLFIPIILSMIFYHEKMSYKKWVAFLLTIISIYYLN